MWETFSEEIIWENKLENVLLGFILGFSGHFIGSKYNRPMLGWFIGMMLGFLILLIVGELKK